MLLEKRRILVFEDNPDNIRVMCIILEHEGAEVFIWAGGQKQDIVDLLPLAVIILDLMMPGKYTGFEVFRQIRSIPELSNIPIVAVSAMDTSVALPQAQELGFSGFISKPISMDLFPEQIHKIISGEEVWPLGPKP